MVTRKIKVKIIRPHSKSEWYSSNEHYRTEASYSDYKDAYKRKYGTAGTTYVPIKKKKRPTSFGLLSLSGRRMF